MKDLRKEYRWALDMIKKAFPKFEVWDKVCDWGNAYVIAIGNKKKGKQRRRIGISLECYKIVPGSGVMQWMPEDEYEENSPVNWELGPPYKYKHISLNKEKNPKRVLRAKIKKMKSLW